MDEKKADATLDARGLACPMPILRARQELAKLKPDQLLKVVATDRGSVKDFQGWAATSKQMALVDQTTEQENGKDVYIHWIRKTA